MKSEFFPFCYYIKTLETHGYEIPLDHNYEEAFKKYPIVPVIGFSKENGKWHQETILGVNSSAELFLSQIKTIDENSEILQNKENIQRMTKKTYETLRNKIRVVEENETYVFRYLFTVTNGIVKTAVLVIDPSKEYKLYPQFRQLDWYDGTTVYLSSPADNSKTMKNQLEEKAGRLQGHINYWLRNRFEDSDEEGDFEKLFEPNRDEVEKVEKKPKLEWKFVKDETQKIVVKGGITEDIFKFCKTQGYEYQDEILTN